MVIRPNRFFKKSKIYSFGIKPKLYKFLKDHDFIRFMSHEHRDNLYGILLNIVEKFIKIEIEDRKDEFDLWSREDEQLTILIDSLWILQKVDIYTIKELSDILEHIASDVVDSMEEMNIAVDVFIVRDVYPHMITIESVDDLVQFL